MICFRKALAALACFVMLVPCLAQQSGVEVSIPPVKPLPESIQMHMSAVLGKRIYVMGGNSGAWSNRVWSAEIQDGTGQLGPWRAERNLPEYLAYAATSTEVVNNRIYVIGGTIYASPSAGETDNTCGKSALWTTVLPDGTLSEWKRGTDYPGTPVACAASCSTDRHLFLTGGLNATTVFRNIQVADLRVGDSDRADADSDSDPNDGAPRNWREAGQLPTPLWFHGAALVEDRMYVWGGCTANNNRSVNSRVYSAPVGKDGSIGEWKSETPMPYPVYSCGYCGFNDHLICIGGRYTEGLPTNAIWYSKVEKGTLTPWRMLKTDLDARVYHAIGFDRARGVVYVTGGQKRLVVDMSIVPPVVNTVQAFRLTQPESARLKLEGQTQSGTIIAKLEEAIVKAKASNKTVLALFYSPEVPACKRFWDGVVNTPAFTELSKPYVFAAVDTSGEGVRYQYQYGLFKIPCMAEIGADGKIRHHSIRLATIDDVKALLARK